MEEKCPEFVRKILELNSELMYEISGSHSSDVKIIF
jgi:hypothetical protein